MTKRYSPEHRRFYNDQYYYKDKEYRPSKRSGHLTKRNDILVYINRRINVAKNIERECYRGTCPSGWSRGQGWSGLYKAWVAFILRYQDNDKDGMETYAKVIRKIEKDLGVALREFPDLKLAALEYMHDDENKDLLEEKAEELDKEVEDLNSEDVLNIMLEQDKFAYELAGMPY